VVATILLLALTVVLFSSIFAFVTSFPSPPAQNANQFQATLLYNSAGTLIVGLNITHLAGPLVPGNGMIYLKSASRPGDCPFTNPATVDQGIPGTIWNLGQTWSQPFTAFPGCSSYAGDAVPDNVTVFIVSQSNLIFSVVLPGQTISTPPIISAAWTYPSQPSVGHWYQVLASISGNLGTNKPTVNGVPGEQSGAQKMQFNATSQDWQYTILAGNTTAAGTQVGFITVTNLTGVSITSAITVTIVAVPNLPLSVGVVLSVSPPVPSTAETVEGLVNYYGPLASAPLSVIFYANETSPTPSNVWSSPAQGGLTVTGSAGGPNTVTAYSLTTWTFSNTKAIYTVTAHATVTGVGSVNGVYSFSVNDPAITVTPTQGPVGSTVTVSGTGFAASTATTLKFDNVAVATCTSGTLTTDTAGTFSCSFKVPSGTSGTTVSSSVASVVQASATFTVTTPTIAISPTQGPAGSVYTVTGSGFTVSAGATVSFKGSLQTPTGGSDCSFVGTAITTDGSGGFVCTFLVPSVAAGADSVIGTDVTTGLTSTKTFTVTTPVLTLSPTKGDVGQLLTATGTGFTVNSPIGFTVGGVPANSTCTSSTTGSFTCSVQIPSVAAGAQTTVATDGSGDTGSASVTVYADPTVAVTPVGPFYYDKGQTATTLTATTTYSGPNSATVEWYSSPISTCASTSTDTGHGGATYTPSTSTVGTNYYCAVVSDSGVPSYTYASNPVEVVVNTALTAPAAPTVAGSAPGPWTVTGTTPSTGTPTFSYQWMVSVNGGTYVAATQCTTNSGSGVGGSSPVTCNIPSGTLSASNTYAFKLMVTDSATTPESTTSSASSTFAGVPFDPAASTTGAGWYAGVPISATVVFRSESTP
jgi:hypothetical protein